jgi:exopolyphosphatase/guanosine-5'-triphosphate,3'-diphosphate pyrophosphatase
MTEPSATSRPRFAAVDVGTNSVLLLVAERLPDGRLEPVLELAEITRLGKGVDATGLLAPESIALTAQVIASYAQQARALGAQQITVVATSAARDAKNGADFFAAVKAAAALDVEIISGDEEARLSYLAAERDFGPAPKVVLDIGGGSTEFIYGSHGKVTFRHSFDVGSVRLTERLVKSDPPTASERGAVVALLDRTFEGLPTLPPGAEVVGIAGTVTTVFSVLHGMAEYDAKKVHGALMSLHDLDRVTEQLWGAPLAARQKLPGLQPKRADVIPAGALVLSRALHRLGAPQVRVSDRGVRWGLLHARAGA